MSEERILAYAEALIGAAIAAALVILLIGLIAWRRRRDPVERERRRRKQLSHDGRIAVGTLLDYDDSAESAADRLYLHYSYTIGGVDYSTCQDVTELSRTGSDAEWPVGAISVKYDVRNPHNSIVVSEDWKGFDPAESGRSA